MKNIEELIIKFLKINKMYISCCESCTGGMLISNLIGVSGASAVVKESYVTYANESKIKILGVKEETINKYNVESIEVAKEMVLGLYNITNSDVCISVTGFAGGNTILDTDGLCFYGIKINDDLFVEEVKVNGSRNECRLKQCNHILNRLYIIMKEKGLIN